MGARERLHAMIMTPPPATNRRAVLAAVVVAAALAVLLSIAVARRESRHTAAGQASTPAAAPTGHAPLTDREFSIAVAIARRETARTARSITNATATVGKGRVRDSNTGHRCTSGTLLHIKVLGDFNIVTGGRIFLSGSTAQPGDQTVHAVLITADPHSAQACLISVQTGQVSRDPGAVVLFTH